MESADLSQDGKFVLIQDDVGADYELYLQSVDGSPAIKLGHGIGGGISPDNKWVASILPSDTTKVLLLPTGVGETTAVTAPNFRYRSARWTSDGHSLIVRASESGHALRIWVQDMAGGSPRAVTPEGLDGTLLTMDHRDYVATPGTAGRLQLIPIKWW